MDLGASIRKALNKITGKVIDEAAVKSLVKDLQRALLLGDVNVQLVYDLSKRIEKRSLSEKPDPGVSMNEHVLKIVYNELISLMGTGKKIELRPQKIMVCGLFGSGKTTQIGKIAKYLKVRGLGVGSICADVTRPAAFEQLQQLSEVVGCDFYGSKIEKKAENIVSDGLKKLKNEVIIADTSGRSALDEELIEELKRVEKAFKPDERILIISADIGQIAKKQAEEFDKAVGLTGIVVTKMDGSAKGGGALSAVAASGAKIMFLGTGEKIADIEEFNPEKFVGELLGVPDFEALMKKIREAAPEMEKEMKGIPEEFDLETFYKQMKSAKKMGPLKGILGNLGLSDVPKEILEESEKKLDIYEAIISSMTKDERKNPEIIKKSQLRIERIAKGSGTEPGSVKKFLAEFFKMKKVYEKLRKSKGLQKNLEKMLKGKGLGGLPFT